MAIILDGKKLSEEILSDLAKKIKKSGQRLKLVGILVGGDSNSKIFLRLKKKACKKISVDFQLCRFPQNISQKRLVKEVNKIVRQKNHGIIIQLPLPRHIKAQEVLNLIPAKKDVDALSAKPLILSPIVLGIREFFKRYHIKIKQKNVVVIGRGRLVGQPVAQWLEKQGIDVLEDSDIKKADIIISGAGKPGLIRGKMIKKGAVVIDAAGDVDFKSVAPKASYITPIFGGVGPLTVAMVLKNLILLNRKK